MNRFISGLICGAVAVTFIGLFTAGKIVNTEREATKRELVRVGITAAEMRAHLQPSAVTSISSLADVKAYLRVQQKVDKIQNRTLLQNL